MATEPKTIEKILIIRLSALGDLLFGLPGLEAIARALPHARIHWLAEEKTGQLVIGHPHLERVLIYPRKALAREMVRPWLWPLALSRIWKFFRQLREEKYDAILDMQGNLKSACQVLLARGERKIGFNRSGTKEGAWRVLSERVDPGPPLEHRIDKDLRLLAPLGIKGTYRPPLLPSQAGAEEEAAHLWSQTKGSSGPRIVIHPGSSAYNAYKRWPASRYGELARILKEKHDARLIILEGPGEEHLVSLISKAIGGQVMIFPKSRNLLQMAALIRQSHLLVGCDSAPHHLAHLQGIPCVAIFGPKSPHVYGPAFVPHRILRYPTPCHPCRLRNCAAPLCILGTHVEAVLAATESLLTEINPSGAWEN